MLQLAERNLSVNLPLSMQPQFVVETTGHGLPTGAFSGQSSQLSGSLSGGVDTSFLLSLRAQERRRQEGVLLQASIQEREAQMRALLALQHQQQRKQRAAQTEQASNEEQQLRIRLALQVQQQQLIQERQLQAQLGFQQQLQNSRLPPSSTTQETSDTAGILPQNSAQRHALLSQILANQGNSLSNINAQLLTALSPEQRTALLGNLSRRDGGT